MTHTEREWRDGQPEGTGLDESTGPGRPAPPAGPLAEQVHEDDPLVERVHEDDPLVERVHEDDPLVERVHEDDPLVERVHEDDPLVERVDEDDPLVEEVHEGGRSAEPAYDGPGSVAHGVGAAQEQPAGLASAGDHERFVARWQEIQAGFVDEPRRAVQDADALVVDMMDRLARMLASEREQLESPGETEEVSTEDLRQGLRRYRALFERLLVV
jgi:hypothetical protein